MSSRGQQETKAAIEVPWDEAREQRVLARVFEERERLHAPWAPRRTLVLGGAVVVAAAAAIALWVRLPRATRAELTASTPSASSTTRAPEMNEPQRMALADGSIATLVRGADIQIEEQRPDRVRIVQKRGEVRYEITPNQGREFSVRAGRTTILVHGTLFAVKIADDAVEVTVQKGTVEVDDGVRTREVGAGESLRVAAVSPEPPTSTDTDPPSSSASPRVPPTAEALLAQADAARAAGQNAEAATALERLVTLYPRNARTPGALFSLGRVERSRGRPAESARAFERCVAAAPSGPLAEDALAEAAVSWQRAGARDAASAAANKYLLRYPGGRNAARMRAFSTP